jgi:hypothetical protein
MQLGRSTAQSSSFLRARPLSGAIGAWLVGSALIAVALACLPIGSAASSASVIATSGRISNSALKGDRLPARRAGGLAPKTETTKTKSETSKSSNIPVGCEAAFSKLVRVGNFTSRCVT